MKPTAFTQRRRRQQAGPGLSLFPFLAVLICTMGALVPLFLAIARQARLQAARQSAAQAAQRQSNIKTEHELTQWRIEQWKTSRQKTQSQLSDARVQLGHLEDHSRRLREQVAGLQATWDQLQKCGSEGSRQHSELEAEWEQVRTETRQAEQQLGDARRAAAERPRSYAVVPYEGPSQTRRRPIYIECRADAVVLQPEGIRLTEEDFEGPMGPGNPLAAALRATREHLIGHGGFDPEKSGEAYPLLLVRPDGIAAYYAARAAMKSWGSEFGYELIDDEWQLAFPQPDPQLAQVVQEALQSARVRQQRLIAAAPRIYGRPSRPTYRAAPGTGGSVLDSGSRDEDDDGFQPRAFAGRIGSRYGAPGGGSAVGGYNSPAGQPAGDGSLSTATAPTSDRYGSPGGGLGGNPQGVLGGSAAGNQGAFGSGSPGDSSGSAPAGSPGGGAGPGGASPTANRYGSAGKGSKEQTPLPDGVLTIAPPHEQPPPSSEQRTSSGEQRSMILRPGEWYPKETPPPEKPAAEKEKSSKRAKSLAKTRGKDWGLPDAAAGSVPITRPIRIQCEADRLVIVPEKGLWGGKAIPLSSRTEDSMDELLSAIWMHMQSWGIAGKGMYWRPVLQVHVAPDAAQRYRDLEMLLEGSGLSIERKE